MPRTSRFAVSRQRTLADVASPSHHSDTEQLKVVFAAVEESILKAAMEDLVRLFPVSRLLWLDLTSCSPAGYPVRGGNRLLLPLSPDLVHAHPLVLPSHGSTTIACSTFLSTPVPLPVCTPQTPRITRLTCVPHRLVIAYSSGPRSLLEHSSRVSGCSFIRSEHGEAPRRATTPLSPALLLDFSPPTASRPLHARNAA